MHALWLGLWSRKQNTACRTRIKYQNLCDIAFFKTFQLFPLGWIYHLFERRMAVLPAPLKITNHSFHLWNVSLKSLKVPCLLTLGSFRATGDNIIEYKAPGTGSSPWQDQFQVRGCEKVAEKVSEMKLWKITPSQKHLQTQGFLLNKIWLIYKAIGGCAEKSWDCGGHRHEIKGSAFYYFL